MQQTIEYRIDDGGEFEFTGELPYYVFPSVTRIVTVNGKPYAVKSYFTGGKDFNAAVKQLALKQAQKQAR